MLTNRWRCNVCARRVDIQCADISPPLGSKPSICPHCKQDRAGFWHVGTFDGEQEIISHTISVDKYPAG
jgi:hypothetical protein